MGRGSANDDDLKEVALRKAGRCILCHSRKHEGNALCEDCVDVFKTDVVHKCFTCGASVTKFMYTCNRCAGHMDNHKSDVEFITCPICKEVGRVDRFIPLHHYRIVMLGCGHNCVAPSVEGFIGKRESMKIITYCRGCYSRFSTSDTSQDFCPDCIDSFNDVRDMMNEGMNEGLTEEEKAMSNKGKEATVIAPAIDKQAVAEGVQTLVDVRVGMPQEFTKPLTYVLAKNGAFEVRDTPIMRTVRKADVPSALATDVTEGIMLKVPKLPIDCLKQTVAFFREVCVNYKGSSEALIQWWWDSERKCYVPFVPDQQVSGGQVKHIGGFEAFADGHLFVCEIHSHGSSMSAFWSGTDNGDEHGAYADRLFGVIGKVNNPIPDWKWRVGGGSRFIDLNVNDVFEVPDDAVNFSISLKDLMTLNTDNDGRVSLSCRVDIVQGMTVPQEWHGKVKFSSHSISTYQANIGFTGLVRSGAVGRQFIYIDGEEVEILAGGERKKTGKIIWRKNGSGHIEAQ